MGILNIDEHVEEHRLMAIRYPSKAVIPGTNVIAVSTIPFLIMPGDGAANGCQFTGTNGAFTLSAAIIASIGTSLAGCYAYFSANFGGSSLPAGLYWTEFSSDTAGIVYAETYTGGTPRRPTTKTSITPNLSGWVTATTNEVVGPQGFLLPGTALGKNGNIQVLVGQVGSIVGTKTYRAKLDATNIVSTVTAGSPVGETIHTITCMDSTTKKLLGRASTALNTGVAFFVTTYSTGNLADIDTSVDQYLSFSLQQSTNMATPILTRAVVVATYGE